MEFMNRVTKKMKKNHIVIDSSIYTGWDFQVSYNNCGHIVLRWFKEQDKDIILVLNKYESSQLISFIKESLKW